MARYSGYCRGGPFDGKELHHPETRFPLVRRIDGRIQALQKGYELEEGEKTGAYVHSIDQWEWISEAEK